jgi:hypothetical protein
MVLSELLAVVPPPLPQAAHADPARWERVEAEMGLRFPTDYKEFIDTFGAVMLPQEMWVYSPFAEPEHLNLFRQNETMLPVLKSLINDLGGYPHDFYPSSPGLLQVARSWVKDLDVFWVASRDHSNWPMFLAGRWIESEYRQYDCSFTSFLAKLYRGEIGEDDWAGPGYPDYQPPRPRPGAQVRVLLVAPQKLDGRTGALLTEVIDEETEVTIWTPVTPEELEEFGRFMRAVEQIDWSEPGIHEVRY